MADKLTQEIIMNRVSMIDPHRYPLCEERNKRQRWTTEPPTEPGRYELTEDGVWRPLNDE